MRKSCRKTLFWQYSKPRQNLDKTSTKPRLSLFLPAAKNLLVGKCGAKVNKSFQNGDFFA